MTTRHSENLGSFFVRHFMGNVVSDNIEIFKMNMKGGRNLVENEYEHLYYCSLPIEAEKLPQFELEKSYYIVKIVK